MRTILFLTAIFCSFNAAAQNTETDSLKKLLATGIEDTKRVSVLESLSYAYLSSYPDSALQFATEGLQLAQKINYRAGEAICINALGNVYFHFGDNARALEMYLEYLKIKEELKDFNNISVAYFNIAGVYTEEQDYQHALFYLFKANQVDEKAKDSSAILYDLYSLGSIYLRMGKNDSALYYSDKCYQLSKELDDKNMIGAVLNIFGETYLSLNDTVTAAKYYNSSIPYAEAIKDNEVLTANYFGLAKIFEQKNMDSSVFYARKGLLIAEKAPFHKQVLEISTFLTNAFSSKKKYDSAFHYQQLSISTKDSLFNTENLKKVQNLKFQEQQRQQATETAKIKFQNKIKLFIAIFVSVIILVIAVILWRNNKQKQKANALLQQQKEKVETTLAELRSSQAQLIHSEKMASLGELTAGIAHEIQNPLNFVNNFSEVTNELIDEMNKEIGKGNYEEVKAIANDIKQSLEKINHHGKRADAIVKGMLQHSQSSSGQKEPTDINKLADEYVRLAYHGLRAKDKSCNATLKTDFDKTLEEVNIIPQDIGRVILNLINNAFYAVAEKNASALLQAQDSAGQPYTPTISLSTKKINDKVEIKIADNGNGIPQKVLDKIFQPFFTTKPTGQGTGLGLSLSYDIIKAHGGEIKVETKEGEGTAFIISLSLKDKF
jgi:two-component system, NtrC family, sensor kinase